jgi:CRISPR/Cas system-associated exonuclease Cas4 (RecB family)
MKSLEEKLSYISKSKKKLYESCPLAFKFNYVDKVPQAENYAFTIGTDVHEFIENFFNIVEIDDNEVRNVSKLQFYPNTDYKKNVVRFELERWDKIKAEGKQKEFFFPVANEQSYTTESPKLTGIVDRIHKCCKTDPFAPPEQDFKDGDLVIVENKTGVPSKSKCEGYQQDVLWYKLLAEISYPELAPIKWSAIYFPKTNYVFHSRLDTDACRALAQQIHRVRDNILHSLRNDDWKPSPSPESCNWCGFKHICEHVQNKIST